MNEIKISMEKLTDSFKGKNMESNNKPSNYSMSNGGRGNQI